TRRWPVSLPCAQFGRQLLVQSVPLAVACGLGSPLSQVDHFGTRAAGDPPSPIRIQAGRTLPWLQPLTLAKTTGVVAADAGMTTAGTPRTAATAAEASRAFR